MGRRRLATRRYLRAAFVVFAGLVATPALAASDCPGNPDALGTSRTIVVDPHEHPRIGTMQYVETLPLQDHEVVLTFDDGPIPKHSNPVLDILAADCIKATFFLVGQMAKEHPDGVRRLRDAGHSIGTHTQHHPLSMNKMPIERARTEIDDGIASVTAALGGDTPAPFFRIPGLLRASAVEDYAASQGLQVWSADFPADDWRHISPAKVHDLAISRIEAKGKGILLLHDIQARTVAALPAILRDLKAKGYRIVHVVPATKTEPATPTEPQQWRMHSGIAVADRWPAVPGFAFARSEMLPIPDMPQSGIVDGALMLLPEPFERVKRLALGAPLPIDMPWSRQTSPVVVASVTNTVLPVPGAALFHVPEHGWQASPNPSKARPIETRKIASRATTGRHGPAQTTSARRAIPGSAPVTRSGWHF